MEQKDQDNDFVRTQEPTSPIETLGDKADK